METIIVATDFSKASLSASKYAASLAVQLHAQLLLVHIIEVPHTPLDTPLTPADFEEIKDKVTVGLKDLKEQLSLYANNTLFIQTEIKYGFVETVLENLDKKLKPIAVVLGLKHVPFNESYPLANTTLHVVPFIKCPVLLIPEDAVFTGIKNISIVSDMEYVREDHTLETFKKWLFKLNVPPDILHICTDDAPRLNILSGNISLYRHLSELSPSFYSIHSKNIEDGIFEFIGEKKADLFIVAPGKYSFINRLLYSSHSKKRILQSNLPVLILPSYQFDSTKKEKDILKKQTGEACTGCKGLCCNTGQPAKKQHDHVHSKKK
jgi:nucleotide-binding universal stress UspA family protein